jgi:hypothetical protein
VPLAENIGTVPWTRAEMLSKLEEFTLLYQSRPIRNNSGGMLSPHMFMIWFFLQKLKPKAIIESGVWLGQGTWFFEKACPDTELYCIDPNQKRIRYRSNRAKYFTEDFSALPWEDLPKEDTLLFFDDHQNAYERLKTAYWFGFRSIIFEDNYPPSCGDFYTIKKIFAGSGFTSKQYKYIWQKYADKFKKIMGMRGSGINIIPPNDVDVHHLREHIEIHYEFPPVFKTEKTRWGKSWDEKIYPTLDPLLHELEHPYQKIFLDEATSYNWMCYLKLK